MSWIWPHPTRGVGHRRRADLSRPGVALRPNNRWLATAGTDNVVRLWYIGAKGPTATPITIRTPRGLITGIAFAGKGDWLATGNDRGNVQLWNLHVDTLIGMANARMLH